MATLLTGFGFLFKEFKSVEKDLREDVRKQSARSDQLYTMFIDLIKSQKKDVQKDN
jgi:hypothetical protein